MRFLKLSLGCVLFFFCVYRPMQANLLASLTFHYNLSPQDQANILFDANKADPCETNILNAMGDAFIRMKNPTMAAIQYGDAMICSPGNALWRFKYGETILMMGYPQGISYIEDALRLEPHNLFFQNDYNQVLTAHQQRSQ